MSYLAPHFISPPSPPPPHNSQDVFKYASKTSQDGPSLQQKQVQVLSSPGCAILSSSIIHFPHHSAFTKKVAQTTSPEGEAKG